MMFVTTIQAWTLPLYTFLIDSIYSLLTKGGAKDNEPKAKEEQTSAESLYNPLNTTEKEIRLLEISPRLTNDGELNLKLFTSALESDIKYCALSYAWGNGSERADAIINGQRVSITCTLNAALKNIRAHILPRRKDEIYSPYIWADGLCTNQDDVEERSTQVGLMGSIYKSAIRVLAYIMPFPDDEFEGGPEDTIDRGMRVIPKIARDFMQFDLKTKPPRIPSADLGLCFSHTVYLDFLSRHPELTKRDAQCPILNHTWTSIFNFANAKYWTRLWMVQEILLPHRDNVYMFYNNEILPFTTLQLFSFIVRGLCENTIMRYELISHYARALNEAERALYKVYCKIFQDNKLPLCYCASNYAGKYNVARMFFVGHQCRDPRDTLYAINDLLGLGLTPDYHKPVKEVFLGWAKSFIRYPDAVVEFLQRSGIGNPHHSQYDLSSWLPDFHNMSKQPNVRYMFRTSSSESTIRAAYFNATLQNDILCIRGTPNGKITDVTNLIGITSYRQLFSKLLCQEEYPPL